MANFGQEADSSFCGKEVEIPKDEIDKSGQKVDRFDGLSGFSDGDQQTTNKDADIIKERRNCGCLVLDESRGKIVGNIDVHKLLLPTDNKQDNEIDLTENTNSKQSASGTAVAVNLMANETHLGEVFENDEGTSAERMDICEPPKTIHKAT